jgi:Bacteriophage tail sheath protein
MPVNPTFPGVYIEEIPSGVRTITGVATSITAFVGRASRGPVNHAITITSFSDFERGFGGVGVDYPMSYAVRDFFLNGGSQAIIVRLESGAATASLDLHTGSASPPEALTLDAVSPGSWGNNLTADVDHDTRDANDLTLFNLTVSEIDPVTKQVLNTEKFLNVSIDDTNARYVPRVLRDNSNLVRVRRKKPADITDPNDPWIVPSVRPEITSPPALVASPPEIPAAPIALGGTDGINLGDNDYIASQASKAGVFALEQADLFNLLCIPADTRGGDTSQFVYQNALAYCVSRRAMLIVDSPSAWSGHGGQALLSDPRTGLNALNLTGTDARNAAVFFPRVRQVDPLRDGQLDTFVPCGIITGVMARTDTQRGVWKAPAGLDAGLTGVQALEVNLTDNENGLLNPLGINCLRSFPVTGQVIWGSRTLRGADVLADEYKYIPVRRLALFIEESLYRGTQWVVFEPNDEPLWAQIRLNVGAFMQNLFRQGAFQGQSPRDAYFVKCDKETTTQNDINLGIVNIVVGFAPLKPAEFVIIKLQQMAGQIAV